MRHNKLYLIVFLFALSGISLAKSSHNRDWHNDDPHNYQSNNYESNRVTIEEVANRLERFKDPAVAKAEGYRKPLFNDGFLMGEHWINLDIVESQACDDLLIPLTFNICR